jgi:hypothetical protein
MMTKMESRWMILQVKVPSEVWADLLRVATGGFGHIQNQKRDARIRILPGR